MTRRSLAVLAFLLAASPSMAMSGGDRSASAPGALPVLRDLSDLQDPSGTLGIGDVSRPDVAERFRPLPAGRLVSGYTSSAHWLRFTLDAPAGEWWVDIQPAFLDDLRLFEPDPASPGVFSERRAGDTLPFSQREAAYRAFVFKLTKADDRPRTYYLRVVTTSSLVVFPRVAAADAFWPRAAFEQAWFLAGPVMMLTVALLNVATWFWLRDRLGLWFIAFLVCLTLSLMSAAGFVSQYIAPDSPTTVFLISGVSTLCAVSFGHGVYRRVFGVDRSQPVFFWLYRACIVLPLVLLAAFLLLGDNRTTMAMALATVPPMNVVGIVLAIRLWRRGGAGAGLMLAANLASMLGLLAYSSLLQGLGESPDVFLYGPTLASTGSVAALQLAVGARYRAVHGERQQAIEEAAREKRIRELSERAEAAIRKQADENARLVAELREALDNVRTLSGFLPICMHCKKIRDDAGFWERIEHYISTHTGTQFSHSICPECMAQHYPEYDEPGD